MQVSKFSKTRPCKCFMMLLSGGNLLRPKPLLFRKWKKSCVFKITEHRVVKVVIVSLYVARYLHVSLYFQYFTKVKFKWSYDVLDQWMWRYVFFPSLIRTAGSEAVSASHYVIINLRVRTFIVAMCALSFSCCWIHLAKISCYKRLSAGIFISPNRGYWRTPQTDVKGDQ